jgi:uncharacterized protein
METYQYIIAFSGSILAGFVNTLAGNGSAIVLAIMTEWMLLPANIANGTNRIGILSQSSVSALLFYKKGKLDIGRSWVYMLPIILGAIIGAIIATYISNEQFKFVYKWMMVAMLFVILFKPERWVRDTDASYTMNYWVAIPMFFVLGLYGGFLQMGFGVFFLAVMVLFGRYNIIEANAIKSFVVAVFTLFTVAIFAYRGMIDWKSSILMAIGQTFGAFLAANYSTQYPQASVWAYRLLVIIVVIAVATLFGLDKLFL